MVGGEARAGAADGWIILRTSSSRTMRLEASLRDDGFEAWTPAQARRVDVPRMNAKRVVRVPIIPSFIFARARHVVDLLELAAMPEKPRRGPCGRKAAHDDFSVFHHNGRIPVIADAALKHLREAEQPEPSSRPGVRYGRRDKVKVKSGLFGGMAGIVLRSNDDKTLVDFGRRLRVEISTFILRLDEANEEQSRRDPAAKAASGVHRSGPER